MLSTGCVKAAANMLALTCSHGVRDTPARDTNPLWGHPGQKAVLNPCDKGAAEISFFFMVCMEYACCCTPPSGQKYYCRFKTFWTGSCGKYIVYLNIPVFLFKQQETNQLELTTYRDGNMNLKTSASTRSYELSTSRLHWSVNRHNHSAFWSHLI